MARQLALDILRGVTDRRLAADEASRQALPEREIPPRDRAFALRLALETLRRLGQLDAIIDGFLERPLPHKAKLVRPILQLGLCQILFMEVPAHAAVDTSVSLATDNKLFAHKGLVNALLRRASREGTAILEQQDAARLNTPDWLWHRWTHTYGEAVCRQIASAHLIEPPLDISVKTDAPRWAETLSGTLLPTGSIRLTQPGAVSELPGYGDGSWWIQDAAATLPAKLLNAGPGTTVLDICAAPGGKTAQLAAAGAEVTAVDRSEQRLKILRENLHRLKLPATVIKADATVWLPDTPADAVLVDAPCSATGTIRRHPDLLRLKTDADVENTRDVQTNLLTNAANMVRPGGTVVFATCSLEPEEGYKVVETVLSSGAPLDIDPVTPPQLDVPSDWVNEYGALRTLPSHLPDVGGMDGFFAMRFIRK